jgi:ribosomal protein L29
MKKKDKKPMFEKTIDKLNEQLKAAKKDFVSLLMKQKIGKLKDVHLPRKKRKEIALIRTIIRQKELISKIKKDNEAKN